MRGEYLWRARGWVPPWELPPRARRILEWEEDFHYRVGTTSACAENTDTIVIYAPTLRNYLRVRGEYYWRAWENKIWAELPPRARRIRTIRRNREHQNGTTSACAENTKDY